MNTSPRKVKYRRLNTNQCSSTINTDPFTYVRGVAAGCERVRRADEAIAPPSTGYAFQPHYHPPKLLPSHRRTPHRRWEIFMTVVRSPHFTSVRPVYWPPRNYVCISIHFYLSTYYRLVQCAAIMAWCECTHANEQFLRMLYLSHFSRWSLFSFCCYANIKDLSLLDFYYLLNISNYNQLPYR